MSSTLLFFTENNLCCWCGYIFCLFGRKKQETENPKGENPKREKKELRVCDCRKSTGVSGLLSYGSGTTETAQYEETSVVYPFD